MTCLLCILAAAVTGLTVYLWGVVAFFLGFIGLRDGAPRWLDICMAGMWPAFPLVSAVQLYEHYKERKGNA